MTNSNQADNVRWLGGGCHCGTLRFEIAVPREGEIEVLDCNCSICTKKGILHLIVPRSRFRALTDDARRRTYQFGTHVAEHWFCDVCGVHPYYRPRSHPEDIDVNVRCLDRFHEERWRVRSFDGRNWEQNVAEIQRRPSEPKT